MKRVREVFMTSVVPDLPRIVRRRSPAGLILLSTLAIGLAYLGMGVSRELWMACAFSVIGGIGSIPGAMAGGLILGFAEAYTAENETSLLNAYYVRPAIVDLAGDVAGRRILDAGCGAGPVSVALRDRGAVVSGFDRSAKMVELARQRVALGPLTLTRSPSAQPIVPATPLPPPGGVGASVR